METNNNTACSPLSKENISLLTLGKSDLSTKTNENDNDSSSLVLMQLPSSLSIKDVQGARMIATQTQQASLVVEHKGMAFDISRVETSNAYILISPTTTTSKQSEISRPCKRIKSNDNKTLVSVHARLLHPGGSGASFLELKPKSLHLSDLQDELKDCVFEPYNADKPFTGKTLQNLAASLQVSQQQVTAGLQRMQAVCLHEHGIAVYGILSQEALQEATNYIVACLAECEEFAHYSTKGISQQTCIAQVMTRVPTDEQYPHLQSVIRHTLGTLELHDDDNIDMDNGHVIQLDVTKVRAILFDDATVVPRLFPNMLTYSFFTIGRWQNVSCTASLHNNPNHGTKQN